MTEVNGEEVMGNNLEVAFSPMELHCIRLTAELAEAMAVVIGDDGPTADNDMREFVAHLHPIQHMLMGQLAARCFPYQFRLLGQMIPDPPAPATEQESVDEAAP